MLVPQKSTGYLPRHTRRLRGLGDVITTAAPATTTPTQAPAPSFFDSLTQSTWVSGIPNWGVLLGGAVLLGMFGGRR